MKITPELVLALAAFAKGQFETVYDTTLVVVSTCGPEVSTCTSSEIHYVGTTTVEIPTTSTAPCTSTGGIEISVVSSESFPISTTEPTSITPTVFIATGSTTGSVEASTTKSVLEVSSTKVDESITTSMTSKSHTTTKTTTNGIASESITSPSASATSRSDADLIFAPFVKLGIVCLIVISLG